MLLSLNVTIFLCWVF